MTRGRLCNIWTLIILPYIRLATSPELASFESFLKVFNIIGFVWAKFRIVFNILVEWRTVRSNFKCMFLLWGFAIDLSYSWMSSFMFRVKDECKRILPVEWHHAPLKENHSVLFQKITRATSRDWNIKSCYADWKQTVIIKCKWKKVETDCDYEENPFSFALLGLWHLWARFERPWNLWQYLSDVDRVRLSIDLVGRTFRMSCFSWSWSGGWKSWKNRTLNLLPYIAWNLNLLWK